MASTLSQLQFGRLRGLRAKLLRRYEHRPLVSCLAGLYGCRWRRYERSCTQPGDCCCNKLEGVSFALLVTAFCLTLVFLYFWGQAKNDYNDFDWFNFGNLGFWFPWSVVLLVIAAGFFTYITVLMLLAVCLLSEGQKLYLHWSHKIGILVSLTFSIVATAVLSDLWSKEWKTLLLSFQVTAPYLHVGGVLLVTAVAWPIALHFFRMNSRVRRGLIMTVYLAILSALYLVPLGLYSPCIKEEGTLGPAPALFGHRGAPMLAPENTLMSFQKAVEAGSEGLETDVTISVDGVPFLMHDYTLRRTTNINQVFPNRTDTPAAMFTWDELESLNAGAWFLSHNPFGTAGSLGAEDRVQAGKQSVCSLQAFLQLAAQRDKLVIFDLYRPPRGHPYRYTWIQRTLEVIQNESSIHSSQGAPLAPLAPPSRLSSSRVQGRSLLLLLHPLTALTFQWTPAAEEAFQTLKSVFTSVPILQMPEPECHFVVSQRSASDQKIHPCAFVCRRLSPAEINYNIGNRKLLVVKVALEGWWHWLEGTKEPRSAKRLNFRQARWSLVFTWFHFTLSYHPGSRNGKPDALSLQFEKGEDSAERTATMTWDI
ncbi:glycerophosphodiester phosphodiesterase domain-containing protein 5-like [Plectropomus leopardus]|uniref:glycerophosphodiester phosphodiesterase domain-containing protein 5-like n=1 Tax=Plectropomus leopardus TaxID=160734 RepID=UPI001C4D122E|nr:glycerophosphodiester phosphodiesterase domain-containing protein 5-like [Plectropomus leopardus]